MVMNKVINLISGPRNISTALMYAFAQREDFKVLDEPFYGYYLSKASLATEHPSQQEIISSMLCEETKVLESIENIQKETNVFVKGMAHHFLNSEPLYLLNWVNIILVRHPKKLITSFSKVIPNPTLNDIGVKKASELFMYLTKNNKTPLVIDSDELMKAPKNYLAEMCRRLEIPLSEKMLTWKTGGNPADGVWAKHWYNNVHKSSGFQKQTAIASEMPNHLQPLLEQAMPYYETFQNIILKNK